MIDAGSIIDNECIILLHFAPTGNQQVPSTLAEMSERIGDSGELANFITSQRSEFPVELFLQLPFCEGY